MLETARPPPADHYGRASAFIGLMLVWFATWTVLCNVAVLTGQHYDRVFPRSLIVPTLITAFIGWWFGRGISRQYAFMGYPASPPRRDPWLIAAILVAASCSAILYVLVRGKIGTHSLGWEPVLGSDDRFVGAWLLIATAAFVLVLLRQGTCRGPQPLIVDRSALRLWRVLLFVVVLAVLYYFGHRADEDDSNFLNLALGAQRTHGAIFELDTMLGDGPGPLHLPTYKFHSFELLVAALSSLFRLPPIITSHWLLPAPQIIAFAVICWLLLAPVLGRNWLTGGVLLVAILFFEGRNTDSWGTNGLIRLFEGKGFLVLALVPLIAGLTARWFRHGQRTDLIGLALAHTCAIGFSANGLYDGPFASGFVALSFVLAQAGRRQAWLRLIWLAPTLSYPVLISIVILVFHLALPSEFTQSYSSIIKLFNVAGDDSAFFIITAMMVASLGIASGDLRKPAILYVPLALGLTLNPWGWQVLQLATGNLGLRVFWAMPFPIMIATSAVQMLIWAGLKREVGLLSVAALALVGAITFNRLTNTNGLAVYWHQPTLKVNASDYERAEFLATTGHQGCMTLAPERISLWLPTIEGAPPPVFARSIYLLHYRFTMNAGELATRTRLFELVEGKSTNMPSSADLQQLPRPIDTIAAFRGEPGTEAVRVLANALHLSGPEVHDDLLVWTGPCAREAGPW